MGPSAIRLALLGDRLATLGYAVEDLGNVEVDQRESVPEGYDRARYLTQIAHTCTRISDRVQTDIVQE